MAVITGFGGHVSKGDYPSGGSEAAVDCIRTWGVNIDAALAEARCSATRGGTLQGPCNLSWGGQYTAYGSTPAIMPGDTFWFVGVITGTGATAKGFAGPAICESVKIDWDIEGGGIIEHTVTFKGDGAYDSDGTVTADASGDDSIPSPLTAKQKKVEIATPAAVPAFNAIAAVRTVSLTLTNTVQEYANSDTAGYTGNTGGMLNATLEISVYAAAADAWASLPQPNEEYHVKIYDQVTAVEGSDTFWELKWVRFGALGGMDVDIEGDGLVGATLSAAMHGVVDIAGTPTVGEINNPATTTIWPS